MEIVEGIGAVGEVIAWVGLIIGLPLLLIGILARAVQGPHTRTKITVLDDLDDRPVALWSTGDRTYTRELTPHQALHVSELPEPFGYVADREPERMRLEARSPLERACSTTAIATLSVAVIGFVASLLPIFWR